VVARKPKKHFQRRIANALCFILYAPTFYLYVVGNPAKMH